MLRTLYFGWIVFLNIHLISVYAQNIGVTWMGKSGMAERVLKGLKSELNRTAPKIKLEVIKEVKTLKKFDKIVWDWEQEKDGIVLLRSSGAKWLSKNKVRIPTFVGACSHPPSLGLLDRDSVAGVTYHLPKSAQLAHFKNFLPTFTSFMLLLEKGHPGTPIDQSETKHVAKYMKIEYKEILASTKKEVLEAITENKTKVSAFIIGNQALVIDMASDIIQTAGNTPVLSYSINPIKEGALGGFSADDDKLGKMLAHSIIDVLIKDIDIEKIDIKSDMNPSFYINRKTLKKLGYKVPKSLLSRTTFFD